MTASLLVCTALLVCPGCTQYQQRTFAFVDAAGHPLDQAMVEANPSRYMLNFPPPRSELSLTDEKGRATFHLPDTAGHTFHVWSFDAHGVFGWREFEVRGALEEHSDKLDIDWGSGKIAVYPHLVPTEPALQQSLHYGSALPTKVDQQQAAVVAGKALPLRTIETTDGAEHTISLRMDGEGTGVLTIANVGFRVVGTDRRERFFCPATLRVEPILQGNRQLVAFRVTGRTVSEVDHCPDRWSGRDSTSIDVLAIYEPSRQEFVIVGEGAEAIAP